MFKRNLNKSLDERSEETRKPFSIASGSGAMHSDRLYAILSNLRSSIKQKETQYQKLSSKEKRSSSFTDISPDSNNPSNTGKGRILRDESNARECKKENRLRDKNEDKSESDEGAMYGDVTTYSPVMARVMVRSPEVSRRPLWNRMRPESHDARVKNPESFTEKYRKPLDVPQDNFNYLQNPPELRTNTNQRSAVESRTPETLKKSVSFLTDSVDAQSNMQREKYSTKHQTDTINPRASLRGALNLNEAAIALASYNPAIRDDVSQCRSASTESEKRTCASGPLDNNWCNSGEPDDPSPCQQSVSDRSELLMTTKKSTTASKSGSNWLADIVEKRKQKALERVSVERLSIPKSHQVDETDKVKRVAFSEVPKKTIVDDIAASQEIFNVEVRNRGLTTGDPSVNVMRRSENVDSRPVVNLKPCLKLSRSFEIPESMEEMKPIHNRPLNRNSARKLFVTGHQFREKRQVNNAPMEKRPVNNLPMERRPLERINNAPTRYDNKSKNNNNNVCAVIVTGNHPEFSSRSSDVGLTRSHSTVKLYLNSAGEFNSVERQAISERQAMGNENSRHSWHSAQHSDADFKHSNIGRRQSRTRNNNNNNDDDRSFYTGNQSPEVSWVLKLEPTVIVRTGSLKNVQTYEPVITRNRNSQTVNRQAFRDFDYIDDDRTGNGRRRSSVSDRYRKMVSGDLGGANAVQGKVFTSTGISPVRLNSDMDRRGYSKADFAIYI